MNFSQNNPNICTQKAQQMASDPAIRSMLENLHGCDQTRLEDAAKLALSGDTAGAANLLQPLLQSKQGQLLLKQIQEALNG